MSEAISFSLHFLILLLFHFLSFLFFLFPFPFSSSFFLSLLFSSFNIFKFLIAASRNHSSFHIQPSTFIILYEPLLDAQEHLHLQQFYLALQQGLR